MRKKRNSKKQRSALAILLAGSMMLGMVPSGMGQVYAADAETLVKEEQTGFLDKAKDFFSDMGEGIADFFTGGSAETEPAAAFDENVVADPSTVDTWQGIVKDTTENIGRIWTDKTVLTGDIKLDGGNEPSVEKGDSDFLVGLSALSSTSNTVETVSRPLDIVLVVDTSGSMDDSPHMGTRPDGERYRYDAVYGVLENWGQVYYTEDGKEITASGKWGWTGWEFTHWELNGKTVEPKTSPDDSNSNHIQFCTRTDLGENITKLQALQDAVNSFVKETAKMNDSIDDVNLQHRISLVKFASDESNNIGNDNSRSQIVKELMSYTSENVLDLTETVNKLVANGATRADYGLNQAQRAFQLGGTREDAQKVVVFFTDGQPTSNSDWSNSVAAAAITNAKALKDANTLIYSIGVFRDANPNDTNTSAGNFNGYMHAVSSNYPYATATGSNWRYSCTLGKRADNSDYYKAATDAAELNGIFNDISSDLETGLEFPTQTPTQGYDPGKVGYITFTDQLGEYMQVDEFKSLVFAERIFNPVGEPVTEGDVTIYKYEGSATRDSELYPNGNVSDIIVKVKKGADLKTGDTVTVQIPAGLIPLRHFTVDTDNDGNKTMDIKEAYPLRIFYGVSIKPEVRERIADGLNPDNPDDEALQQYMNAHNKDGVPQFYSNYYNGQYTDPNGKRLGNTIASFQPSEKNAFYYFTEDTPIYEDAECTETVKDEPTADKTYYYKRPYVQLSGNKVEDVEAKVAFAGANFQQASANFGINSNGEYYIKSGSARLTRVDALIDDKTDNTTNTAEVVIDPIWDNVNNPDYLNVYLGNNGRLDLELPGALAISKDARVEANKNLNADEILKDKQFKFQISIPSMKEKTVKAEVRNEQNEIQGTAFDLTFNREGIAEYQIKNDETLYIHGLDKDAAYTVTEKDLPNGFELTAVDKNTDAKQATGTIVSGQSVSHVFENTYDVKETTLADTDFAKYEKQFERWDIADTFQIELISTTDGAPLPNGAVEGRKSVDVTETNPTGNFGAITYSYPGVYEYVIQEKQPANTIPGVVYSLASYTYRVTVTDNGDGTLSAAAVMEKTAKDDGTSVGDTPTPVADKTAVFVNDFHAESATTSILARKVYTDNSGVKPLLDRMFEFKLKAIGDNADKAPMPVGVEDSEGYIHAFNDGTGIAFGNMVFTEEHVNTPWTYEIKELIPAGAVANQNGTHTLNGMTYDGRTYTVSITAKAQGEGDDARIVIEKIYSNADGIVAEDQVVFNNSYEPKSVVLSGEGESAVQGRKTLVGRDSLVDEEFSFTLSAANTAARTGLEEDFIIFNGDTAQNTMQKTVSQLTNDKAKKFNFDSIEFKRPGIYVFNVVENAPENGKGMVYDRHTARVRVTVTDDNGELKAETAYYNGEGTANDNDAATFVNQYTASTRYGTGANLIVEKTLNGRNLKAGEFKFNIEGVVSDTVTAEDAEAKLSNSDIEFTNTSGAADGVASRIFDKLSGVTFTQDDAGKTFSYVLSEAAGNLPGVTYSKDTYRFDITVEDNSDGTMHTVTKVTMQGDGVTAEAEHDSSNGRDTIVAGFTNGYHADSVEVDFTEAATLFHKRLVGRDWKEDDSFTFNLTAEDGTPMPQDAEGNDVTSVTVSQKGGTEDGTDVPFGFGKVTYDTVGIYSYNVTETNGGQTINGVTYSKNVAEITVVVSDPGNGQLTANVQSYSTTFINEYNASLNLGAAGGLAITKTVTGHALAEGQFEFKVKAVTDKEEGTATAEEAAELFGFKKGVTEVTFKNNEAAADGQPVTMLKTDTNFTLKNLGKVYKYEVSETNDKKPGYTYDDTVYTVELRVTDDLDGTLTLHAKVNDGEEITKDETTADNPIVLAFTNRYAATGELDGSDKLKVTKILEDRNWLESDSFSFKLEATGETVSQVGEGKPVQLPDNAERIDILGTNETHEASFGDITFTKPGTYTFAVSEIIPENAVNAEGVAYKKATAEEKAAGGFVLNGITYDSSVKKISVNVTDKNDGKLEVTMEKADLTFKNKYKATGITLTANQQFKVSKTLEGRDWKDGEEFTFTLTSSQKGVPMPDNNEVSVTGANGEAVFGSITYDKAGTYVYEIKEKLPEGVTEENKVLNGIEYDTHTETVTVIIRDDTTGNLVVDSVTYAGGTNKAEFVNKYNGSTGADVDVAALIDATKTLHGRDMAENEFNFEVVTRVAGNAEGFTEEVVATGTNAAAKEDAPGKVTFAKTDGNGTEIFGYTTETLNQAVADKYATKVGNKWTVNYTAREKTDRLPNGVTAVGKTEFNFTIEVTDNAGGTLTAEVKTPEGDIAFENEYRTEDAVLEGNEILKVTKIFTGKNWTAESFKFMLEQTGGETSGVTMPNETEITLTKDVAEKAFGDITFSETGEYQFTITEVSDENGGVTYEEGTITYDTHSYVVDVSVTDDGQGHLIAAPTVQTVGSNAFENRFNPVPEIVTLEGTKNMIGRELRDTDKFQFTIRAVTEGAPLPAVTTVENVGNKISFAPIRYEIPNNSAEYKYVITENDINPVINGVTKDAGEVMVTVTITFDPETGMTTQDVRYEKVGGNGGEGFAFVNKYEAAPAAPIESIEAFKSVTASEGNSYELKGGEFEFTITPSTNNDKATDPISEAIQVSNDAQGKILLKEDVVFTAPGTYEYTVREVSNGLGGMSYDDTTYTIQVVVSNDDGSAAQLKTAVTFTNNKTGEEVDSMTFNNSYDPKETSVTFSGTKNLTGKALADGDFTFVLEDVSGEEVAATEKTAETVTNKAGAFAFGEIKYTAPGTYKYQIRENNDGKEGYTYDETVYDITVVVTDVDGVLKAEVTGADAIVFNNSYKANPVTLEGETALKAEKMLEGRDLNAEEFEFELKDKDGNVVATGKNDVDGNVTFGALTFEETGTFYYTISEKVTSIGGVTYDETVYTVEVVVTDAGGHLNAAVRYLNANGEEEIPTFVNTYKAADTEVTLGASKIYKGAELKDKQFTFELKNQDGKVVSEAKNGENGQVAFETITFDEAGTYKYTISEKNDKQKNVTYDKAVYEVTVTVTDNGEGSLIAEVAYADDKAPVFTNKYTKPAEPSKPEEPKKPGAVQTGDSTPIVGLVVAMVVALAAIVAVAVIFFRRRRR